MKEIISINAPGAIGPYSQAICSNGVCYLSGQIPLGKNGELVEGSIEKQAEQVFKNIEAILLEQKASLKNIIKLNVYLTDIKNFETVNKLMMKLFKTPYPARALVEVSALPKGVAIEIEAIAEVSDK